jgi:hypothetical protein
VEVVGLLKVFGFIDIEVGDFAGFGEGRGLSKFGTYVVQVVGLYSVFLKYSIARTH